MTPHLGKAALWYARSMGWPVFPLRPHTKEPFSGLGVYHATTDAETVSAWWDRWPHANIGFHPGPAGVLAFDADAYKQDYAGGDLLTFEERETVTSITGGGGEHLLYEVPDGIAYGNSAGRLPDGIDIKSTGGYIVLPPSIHPNGTPYRWELGYGPHEHSVASLPARLRALLDAGHCRRLTICRPSDLQGVEVACRMVEDVLAAAGVAHGGRLEWQQGRKWVFDHCPFMPDVDPHTDDRAAFAAVLPDGRITAGCHHQRCRQRLRDLNITGWRYLKLQAVRNE